MGKLFTIGHGMADEDLFRVALGVAAVAARQRGRHGLARRRFTKRRAIEVGALLAQHGAQVKKTAVALGIEHQFPRLTGQPLPAQVVILDLEMQAQGFQFVQIEVIDEELMELGGVGLGHGVWSTNDSPANNQRQRRNGTRMPRNHTD